MIQVKTKTIAGAKYDVTQMTARAAIRMQARLIKFLGPSVGEFFGCKDANLAISKAIRALATTMNDNEFDSLVMDLMQYVRKEGYELTAATIDFEFAGQLNTLFEVVAFVLEANYSDFFAEGGIMRALMDETKKAKADMSPD